MCEIYDDGERSTVYVETQRRARKEHRCLCCDTRIAPGATYTHASSLYDGRWSAWSVCEACHAAIREFQNAHHTGISPDCFERYLEECIAEGDEGARWAPMHDALKARIAAAREVARG